MTIRVVVAGVTGRMGQALVRAASETQDVAVVGGVGRRRVGEDVGLVAGCGPLGVPVMGSLEEALDQTNPHVLVELSTAEAAPEHVEAALRRGLPAVVGTTGIEPRRLEELAGLARERGLGLVVAPNFAIGAVLLMRFAEEAARYFPAVEIIELHHGQKRDAPSGTALETARRVAGARGPGGAEAAASGEQALARGLSVQGVPVHSVRLPGLVAHQEVIFGLDGQTLTLRHDATTRDAFMPGLLLAIRRVQSLQGPVFGLDPLLFPTEPSSSGQGPVPGQ